MIDVRHIPYGCSVRHSPNLSKVKVINSIWQVWPSFWTLGTDKEWPGGGEIDVIEGINMMDHNQIALHTTPGCFQAQNSGQTGQTIEGDCSTPQGCLVAENKPNSWGPGFAQAGGGVWALQIDVAGIFVWYWSVRIFSKSFTTSNDNRGPMYRKLSVQRTALQTWTLRAGDYLALLTRLLLAISVNSLPLSNLSY